MSQPSSSVPVPHLAHLKRSEVELRNALHAVNALTDRFLSRGEYATVEELADLAGRIEAAAAQIRAIAALAARE